MRWELGLVCGTWGALTSIYGRGTRQMTRVLVRTGEMEKPPQMWT